LICNLSRLGAYIALDPSPPVGAEIHLAFVTAEDIQLDLRAAVSWHSPKVNAEASLIPPGCGVRFVALS